MAKNNEFVETLQKSVVSVEPTRGGLEQKRQELQNAIAEMESNVIKDPRTLEKLKKELANVEKAINKQMAEKAVEQGEVAPKSPEKITDEDKEQKEGEKKDKAKKSKSVNPEEARLKQAYHDAIVAYYDCRMVTLKHQREAGKLLSDDIDHLKEETLEVEMYRARKAYMAVAGEDPYEKFRANHDYIDRQAHEPFESAIREKARKYRQIEQEIEKIDKTISEINEELDNKDLSQRDRNERNEEIAELEAKKTQLDLEKAEYKDVKEITEKQRLRASQSVALQDMRRAAASPEQLKGYDYRRGQRQVAQHNLDVAQRTEYQNIQKRIEEREERIKDLTKKLDRTPDGDLEERLNILESLNRETNMLQADEEQQHKLDKGYVMTENEMQQETYKAAQVAEQVEREFKEDTREVREAIEQKDTLHGEAVVEQTTVGNVADKESEINAKAAMAAAVVDSPEPGRDTLAQDAGQFMVAKCVIEGMEDKVRDPNNPDDAMAMVEHEEQLQQADKQLDELQNTLEEKI